MISIIKSEKSNITLFAKDLWYIINYHSSKYNHDLEYALLLEINYLTQYFHNNLLAVNTNKKKPCDEIKNRSIKNKNSNDNRTTMIKEIIVTSVDKTKFVGIIIVQN